MEYREITPDEAKALGIAWKKNGCITVRNIMMDLPHITPEQGRKLLGRLNASGFVMPTGTRRGRSRLFKISPQGLAVIGRLGMLKLSTSSVR